MFVVGVPCVRMVSSCVSTTVRCAVSGVTNVSQQVDRLSSPTALLVNEVREPQSTQSAPLSPNVDKQESMSDHTTPTLSLTSNVHL